MAFGRNVIDRLATLLQVMACLVCPAAPEVQRALFLDAHRFGSPVVEARRADRPERPGNAVSISISNFVARSSAIVRPAFLHMVLRTMIPRNAENIASDFSSSAGLNDGDASAARLHPMLSCRQEVVRRITFAETHVDEARLLARFCHRHFPFGAGRSGTISPPL